jgi:Uma2 family endonuclease
MGSTAKRIDRKYTYADYLTWPDEERWEIIDGDAHDMTPSPSFSHQQIVGRFFHRFAEFFVGKPCVPVVAPFDVVLDDTNIVQPDLLVVCDPAKITEANIQGAPDLVIEVLSPSTRLKDKREKKALYERFGVKEYVLVHPQEGLVDRYRLVDGRYLSEDVFNWDETFTLTTFPDLVIDLWDIFGRELLPEEKATPAGSPGV